MRTERFSGIEGVVVALSRDLLKEWCVLEEMEKAEEGADQYQVCREGRFCLRKATDQHILCDSNAYTEAL